MTIAQTGDRLLGRAYLASLALHLGLFALIPPLLAAQGPNVETISFVRVVQFVQSHPSPQPQRSVAAAAPVAAPIPRIAEPRKSSKRASRHAAVKHAPIVPRAPVVAAIVHPGTGSVDVRSTAEPVVASPAPQQPVDESPPRHTGVIGGAMPLGADEPAPVLEPAVHQALIALGVHVTLTVDVDAEGRVKSVVFDPPLDAATEDRIRTMLAAASWDPAVCGVGITCEGNATIKL